MTQKITEEQVRHIAHLSRLKLSDEEIAQFGVQLAGILAHMESLSEVNTDGIEPTAHPLPMVNVLRDDEPVAPIGVDAALANAPACETPYFKVPKVLDQETA
ncbi:MAG: Asp-tRNA(Asn)/Glu-tRNA(Gln) amidotransferase subunit GatC [Planctomycetota bacterium]